MNLENTMLSEGSQTQKDTYCILTHFALESAVTSLQMFTGKTNSLDLNFDMYTYK